MDKPNEMSRAEAMEVLERHQSSRITNSEQVGWDDLTQAIDVAIRALGDGWVSVEDGLPECEVLATDWRNYLVGKLGGYEDGPVHCETTHEVLKDITHYQIPSPPKPKQP